MNRTRYLAYRSARRLLERTPEFDHHECERLRDTAEGLLLTTDPDDAEPLRRDAALALSMLVGRRRCDDVIADAIWQAISDCGPPDSRGQGRRGRGLTFAGSL